MEELKPCPFCGFRGIRLHEKNRGFFWIGALTEVRIERLTYYAACNRCHARGGTASGNIVGYVRTVEFIDPFDGQTERLQPPGLELMTTKDEIKKRAAELWNRRAE